MLIRNSYDSSTDFTPATVSYSIIKKQCIFLLGCIHGLGKIFDISSVLVIVVSCYGFLQDIYCYHCCLLLLQLAIDKVPKLDLKRTFVFTFLGLVLVGPTLHVWYLYLSKLVTINGASGAIARLLLDQFIFSPIFIGVFMSLLVTLEGKPSLVVPKLKQEWLSSVIANWQLWIPFQFLNFYFVPQKFQVFEIFHIFIS
jgi:hypothetical protein